MSGICSLLKQTDGRGSADSMYLRWLISQICDSRKI